MKCILFILFLALSFGGYSQNTLTVSRDSLFYENTPVARIEKSGFGLKVSSLDGKELILISEGGYSFKNGKASWPHKTTLSMDATVSVLNRNKLFKRGGLDAASVESFIQKYPVKQSVLPTLRTFPISKEEE